MKINLVQIGNSRGIRIPKLLIEQYQLEDEIELKSTSDGLMIHSVTVKRQGWAEAFSRMQKNQDDRLLDGPAATTWDQKEWQW